MYTLSNIIIYPVKSLQGISLPIAEVENRGLRYDRRWMIIDEQNRFITQRSHPELTSLTTSLDHEWITITDKGGAFGKIRFESENFDNRYQDVKIWRSVCIASIAEDEVNEWFSDVLQQKVRLAYMPDSSKRYVNPEKAENKIVSFADGYPFLLMGEESLKLLNSKLEHALSMNRFRPNLVFSGGDAHDEDDWQEFSIGEVNFKTVGDCIRCKVISIDPQTGEVGEEPMKTLKTYRKDGQNIIFGKNLVAENNGMIKVGYMLNF